jgi:hypothetical protein
LREKKEDTGDFKQIFNALYLKNKKIYLKKISTIDFFFGISRTPVKTFFIAGKLSLSIFSQHQLLMLF